MDTLNIDHPTYYDGSLLTENEKIAMVIELLGASFKHHGELFIPDDDFYDWSDPTSGLQTMAKKLFTWLGLKPSRLGIEFSSNIQVPGMYTKKDSQHKIFINERYAHNPFQCATILSHEIMHYFLITKKKLHLESDFQNEQITDLATIYSGLGVVIINGFGNNSGWINKQWHRMLGIFGTNPEHLDIGLIKPSDYAQKITSYAASSSINPYAFTSYLQPGTKHFFPEEVQTAAGNALRKPFVIHRSEQDVHSNNVLTLGLLLVVIATTGVGMYLAQKKPQYLSEDLRVQRQKIETLKSMYDTCVATVAKKRTTADQTDILTEESINTDANRCISIRNNHDYEVRLYNQQILDLTR